MVRKTLAPGDTLPAFATRDHNNEAVSDTTLRNGKPFVVYFYPADETPGCTAQACEFRDQFEVFSDAGATVWGVSADSPEKHRAFRERHRLPFTLLSDEDGSLRAAFGVSKKTLGLLAQRITFVFDASGVVQKVFSSHLQPKRHISEALDVLIRDRPDR